MDFAHLHLHTDMSMLDGFGKPDAYVERAVQLGQPAIAVTDHGNLYGVPEFYLAARKAGIEPILGSEFYYVPDIGQARSRKGKADETDSSRYHLTVLAVGARGYQALAELSTESYRNFYYKPLIDRSILESCDSMDHLYVLSGCAASILSRLALMDLDSARDELRWWKGLCPNFAVELQEHGTDQDKRLNKALLKLAKLEGVPHAITNDPHYVDEEDCTHHGALLALQTGSNIDDPNRFKFDGEGFHLRSSAEMAGAFEDYPLQVVKDGLANTIEISKKCHTRIPQLEKRTWLIPKIPGVDDAQLFLRKLVARELKTRSLGKAYRDRAKHELEIIEETGIADFLLIARDSVRWARKRGIPVGPGRGSVCSSLVAYLVGVHGIDPVKFNLLFERFLNPARPSMPDIDTDFGQDRRGELFDYARKRYGEGNVMHVAAIQRMKVRKMFTGLAKAHGLTYQEAVEVSKTLDTDSDEVILPKKIEERYPELASLVEKLSGVRSGISNHPAGVIIASPEHEIYKHIPQAYIPSSKRWVAQYDLDAVGKLGYLKQDFLGLRTLDTVEVARSLIEARTGETLDPYSWVPDEEPGDDEVYAMLASGDTAGVFQMEGYANTRGVRDVEVSCFEDIVACTALYRSGPMKAGFPEQFVANRTARSVLHPELEKILAPTHGTIVYQEQAMAIGKEIAGWDWDMVDDLKDAVAKKKPELMASLQDPFVKGVAKVVGVKQAKWLWEKIEGFSGYAFNRAHAVGYSYLSYVTARLKHLYPLEFYVALIRTVDDDKKRTRYLQSMVKRGYRIIPPEVNRGDAEATPVYGNRPGMRFGLLDLAGLGKAKIRRLMIGRPYTHPGQVANMVDKGVYSVLQDSGAMRSLGIQGNSERASKLLGWNFTDRMERYRDRWESLLIEPDGEDGDVQVIGELVATHQARTKGGKPFQTWTVRWDVATEWKVRLWSETQSIWGLPLGTFVRIQGEYQAKWENITCGGRHTIWVWDRKWIRAGAWQSQNSQAGQAKS